LGALGLKAALSINLCVNSERKYLLLSYNKFWGWAAGRSLVANLLEELLQVGLLVLEEVDFFLARLHFLLFAQHDCLVASLLSGFQLGHLVLVLGALDEEFGLSFFELHHAVFGLELLLHREVDRGVVQGLVRLDRFSALVAHTQQQEAALRLSERYLSNNFVKSLLEKVFANGADTLIAGLSLQQSRVKGFSQAGNIHSGGLLMGHILNEVFFVSQPLSGGQDSVHDIAGVGLAL
jgi:hypothetical protein